MPIKKTGTLHSASRIGRSISAILICASFICTACTSCAPKKVDQQAPSIPSLNGQDATSSTNEPLPDGATAPTDPDSALLPPQNFLTGELATSENMETSRPVAVMINNIAQALPQRGINDASILYEMPVEGGVTRLMAVYPDYKSMPTIGSIRSARHDFVEIVKSLDALYVHIGHSDSGKAAIDKYKINDLDGIKYANLAFFKDEKRAQTRSSEHCWYTKPDLLQKGIDKIGASMTLENGAQNKPLFNFSVSSDDSAQSSQSLPTDVMEKYADAQNAPDVNLTVSPGIKVNLTYDKQTGKYKQSEYGQAHIDENSGETYTCKNVFLMYTDVSMMPDNYHKEIDLSNGEGYYLSNGKACKVTFKKPTVDDKIKVYSADSKELLVNPGNSYFAIIPKTEEKNITFEAKK